VVDRVAKQIIIEAEQQGVLKKGSTVYEGTAGSTGISLALAANARGYKCHIFMPDDQAKEKSDLLEKLGAKVDRVRPVSFSHPDQFCNQAKRRAQEDLQGGLFANQFENLANYRAHYLHTGPEIWKQTNGKLDAFVAAAGISLSLLRVFLFVSRFFFLPQDPQ
jgi:cysteine synthase A